MTQEKLIAFLRAFRRPYASMLSATTLCACVVVGAFTGEWIPAALAAVLASLIVADGVARTVEKNSGASGD